MTTKHTSEQTLPNVPGAAMVQAIGDAVFGKGNAVVEATYPVTFAGRPVTERLSVEEVVAYLTREGWKRSRQKDPFFRLFNRKGATARVRVDKPHPEHGYWLGGTVCSIAETEGRHPLDVVDAILAARTPKRERVRREPAERYVVKMDDVYVADFDGNTVIVTPRQREAMGFTVDEVDTFVLDAKDGTRSDHQRSDRVRAVRLGGSRDNAITAAILRLFAVAPATGIAEDEVVRHLLASGLDVDSDDVGKRLIAMTTGDAAVLNIGEAVALTVLRRGEPDKRVGVVLTYARGPAFPATTMGDRR